MGCLVEVEGEGQRPGGRMMSKMTREGLELVSREGGLKIVINGEQFYLGPAPFTGCSIVDDTDDE